MSYKSLNQSDKELISQTAHACVTECKKKWPMVTLGSYLQESNERNIDEKLDINAVMGISINKNFFATKANMKNVSLRPYKIIAPQEFAYVNVTSRNGDKISIAINSSGDRFLVSSSYTAFRVKDISVLNPEYLYLQFNRPEFDRYARFNSWGTAREIFSWNDLCRVKISLPPIEVQQTYVNAYKGLTALIDENEKLSKSLEVMAQACVTECREKWPMVTLGSYLQETNERNVESKLSLNDVRGISTDKIFIDTKANLNGVKLSSYKIVKPKSFAFVPDTSRRGDKIAIALNSSEKQYLVSAIYIVYKISNSDVLLPEYLHLQFNRPEFDRYARFNSWGTARETFDWDDMCRVKIPLPPIEVQQSIVALFHCAEEARKIAEEAKAQLSKVCPAMIQRAAHCH